MSITVSDIEYEKIEGLQIKSVDNKLWFFCIHCDYNNDRKYHAKMHFKRIHVNGGHALKNKRKYPQKSTSMCDFFRQSIHSETLEKKNLLLENFKKNKESGVEKKIETTKKYKKGKNAWTNILDRNHGITEMMTEMIFEEYNVRLL